MNPSKGQLIEIRFANGVHFDAIVENWSDQKSTLKLPNSNDIVIIQNTLRDVLLVKIAGPKKTVEPSPDPYVEFEQIKSHAHKPENLTRMAELQDQINRVERFKILNNMHHLKDGMKDINYAIPGSLQVSSPPQHTVQKTRPADSQFSAELQGLFSKENY